MTRNLTVLATLCFAFPICAQDYEHPWKKFGEGSRVKTFNRFERGDLKHESTDTKRIKAVTKDEIVIESVSESSAGEFKQEIRLSLKGLPGSSEDRSKKVGAEEVEVEGKKYACEIWEFPTDDAVTKAWLCKDVKVPGGALRVESVSRQPQAQAKFTARVVKLSEKVKIAGQELDCAVVETRIDGPAVKYKGKAWHSPDVPGFQVKSEFDTSEGRLTSEVVEFEKK